MKENMVLKHIMDKKKIKYFYFDMDGTLLDDNRKLSQENVMALRRLIKEGYKVGIVSGRPDYIMKEEVDRIEPNLPLIAINGAKITHQEKLLNFKMIDPLVIKKIIHFLINNHFTFLAYSKTGLSYHLPPSKKSGWLGWHFKAQKKKATHHQWAIKKLKNGDTSFAKILVITSESPPENEQKLKTFIAKFPSVYGVASTIGVWDLMPVGNSKGQALQFLAQKKFVDLTQTVVFGDAENDLSMFKVASFSVAMQNANQTVKNVATIINRFSNQNSGVAKFLGAMIFNGPNNN